ncbi:hypothetical protein PFLUV_G00128630 [Perca fluviatilis]|uniref:Uncharacterized protein n=1 Tax=Perca fluviatilis TaxID=8168 RepID=A0A6A5EQA7_PERFL|nr:hypothetical protein PFLUV_G00128630 [Perca fluviatilis]
MLKHTHASVWEKRTTSLQSLGFSSTRVQEIQSAATPREKKISKPGRCRTQPVYPSRALSPSVRRGFYSSTITTISSTSSFCPVSVPQYSGGPNRTRGFYYSTISFCPVSVPSEVALSAVHPADSEESGVLLWTLSADDPQKQGTVHQLNTC